MKKISVKVHINGDLRSLVCAAGTSIPEALQKHRIPLPTPCGGYGTCGKCRVRFLSAPPEPAPADVHRLLPRELKKGVRLACRHRLDADTEISIDAASLQGALHILTHGIQIDVAADPAVDTKALPGPVYGAAVDLGTTTLVASLIDLQSGERLELTTAPNPQTDHGGDIISRATAAVGNPGTAKELRERVVNAIGSMLKELTGRTAHIYHVVLAGNAVMSHLFLGEKLDGLVRAPYEAAFTGMRTLNARESGLPLAPGGKCTVLPAVGSFIGGDVSADILAGSILYPGPEKILFMDLGTNCEIVLRTPEFVKAVSAPAGPVMEGAGIRFGMSAGPGAVTDLIYDKEKGFSASTVEGAKIRGICGSGLIHIIHLLRSMGVLLPDGRFSHASEFADPRRGFRVGSGVYVTPQDIRAFQMAKSAIASSWKMLFELNGVQAEELDRIAVAGAFGHYIRPKAGMDLGLFPVLEEQKFIYLGNGSLSGCETVLRNKKYARRIRNIASAAEHVELAGRPDFQEMYALNMGLGHDVYL